MERRSPKKIKAGVMFYQLSYEADEATHWERGQFVA